MTELIPQPEMEHSSAQASATASSGRPQPTAKEQHFHTLFQAKLRAYCLDINQREAIRRSEDLADKVRYICNDLELILAELESPAFAEFDAYQQSSLHHSRTAVKNAMHHLDLTRHWRPTAQAQ